MNNLDITDVDLDTINKIIKLRNEFKTYDFILKEIDITKDKLIKICKIHNLNFSTTVFKNKKLNLNKNTVIEKYYELKSLRKTAKYFDTTRDTIIKYIPQEIRNKNRVNKLEKVSKSDAVIDWRKRTKQKLVDYKGGKCIKCGYNKSIQALQFHHLDPSKKDFNISAKSYGFERLKLEVDKCILVCSNCHIEILEELRTN